MDVVGCVSGRRLRALSLRGLRPRSTRRLLVQGPRVLPALWWPPHGGASREARAASNQNAFIAAEISRAYLEGEDRAQALSAAIP
jgi:hypothetical protein